MPQFKAFALAVVGELTTLEAEVNAWLERERPQILFFAQTHAGNGLALSFVYERSAQMSEAAASASTEVPAAFEQSLERVELDPADLDVPLAPEADLPY